MSALEQLRAMSREASEPCLRGGLVEAARLGAYPQALAIAIAEIEGLTALIERMREAERAYARSYAETYQRNSGGLRSPS